jgi:hypothetical protein
MPFPGLLSFARTRTLPPMTQHSDDPAVPDPRHNGDRPAEDDLFEQIERRAFDALTDDDDDETADDLVALAGGDVADSTTEPAHDVSLGGYIEKHNRVPAFDGSDGQPYTVDIDVEHDEDEAAFVSFLIFIRWAATGAGIMDHLESGDIARADTEDEARRAALDLSLYEIKAELDAAIARRRTALEE